MNSILGPLVSLTSVLLLALIELAGERVDHSVMAAELARISSDLQALPRS